MKIFLSPAKLMQTSSETTWKTSTTPQFLDDSQQIMDKLKTCSPAELKSLMKLSDDLAMMNVERNQAWTANPDENESLQAALSFDGAVYKGLRENDLDQNAIAYLEKNAYILSGLYGILRPTDRIMPYRLEMGTAFSVGKAKNLHAFWKETLTSFVNQNTQKGEILLNLASNEYLGALNKKQLHGELIDVKFKDFKDGKLKQIMVYFKQARGAMANYCAQNQVNTLDELKAFDGMGYQYDDSLSTEKLLVFTR